MKDDYVLEVQAVGKRYGKHWALRDTTFSLHAGDVFGVIGENGAGKSTLLSVIATLLSPTKGTILFHGEQIKHNKKDYRSKIGYVPQEIALYDELSGYDNLEFFARAYHIPKELIGKRIAETSEIVSFSQDCLKQKVSEYSGGMKRKLNIAAALLHQPELLLLDEPTANIDFHSEDQIIKAIRQLAKEKVTVIYVGHQMDLVEQLCNRFCLMNDGRQVLQDTMEHALTRTGKRISLKQLCESKL